HFNPVVSLVFALRRELPSSSVPAYIASQIVGGIAGTMLAHAMFALPVLQASETVRLKEGGGCFCQQIGGGGAFPLGLIEQAKGDRMAEAKA
ncbi:aquaporin, partial [Rhizobium johnstonii]|uniref:aquaporin n=1 Tax=Rhizobium johnstonii TaxID=3019933 RepID=UPI003F98E60F